MLMFFALCGCKSARATVEIPVLIHDTTVTVRHLHDSTYVDRWHTVYQKGDTVYDTKTITITKTVTKTDTVFRASEKPVTVTRCQIKEVERRLTAWQRFRLGAFWWLLLAVGLSLPVPLLRRKFASKNK